MNRTNEYRAKAFELLSLAETVNDPERRADMLRSIRDAARRSTARLARGRDGRHARRQFHPGRIGREPPT